MSLNFSFASYRLGHTRIFSFISSKRTTALCGTLGICVWNQSLVIILFFLASLMMAFHSLVLVFFGEFLGGIL